LIGTSKIEDLVRYVLLSGYVKRDTAPLSLILIANPEHNKTSILKEFENSKSVMYTTDLSPKPLIEFLKKAAKEHYFHLIVPDFIKVVLHNKITAGSTVTTLNGMIEEGIQNNMYYGQEIRLDTNVKCGLITGITPELFKQQFKAWSEMGFLSRLLPVSYQYSDETRHKIHSLISGMTIQDIEEKFRKVKKMGQKEITINSDISAGIQMYTDELKKKLNSYQVTVWNGSIRYNTKMNLEGFRLHRQLRLLAQSIALDRGLTAVNYECLAELKLIGDYIRTPNDMKLI